eukprot:g42664.t1
MREELARVGWNRNLAEKTVEQQWPELMSVIREAQQKFIPRKKKHIKWRIRQPWLTRVVKDNVKAKEKACNVVKFNGKPEDWETFKNQQRKAKEKSNKGEKIKYDDDTKVGGGTDIVEEVGRLRKDLDRPGEWAQKWQMEHNVGKFKPERGESVELIAAEDYGGQVIECIQDRDRQGFG